MFDIGWTELLLIAVVALIVIGPKDLPQMFHALGRITARARGMAREFSSAMEDAAKASGLDDVQNTLRDAGSIVKSPRNAGVEALTRAAERFEKWDPMQPGAGGGARGARPDPAMSAAAKAAAPSVASPASSASAATEATSPAHEAPAAPAPADPAQDAGQGARRLHAVRRSDLN